MLNVSESLRAVGSPNIHVGVGSSAWAYNLVLAGRLSGLVATYLRGVTMRTYEGMHNELAAAFQFPDYYGRNWMALDECITDLDWLAYPVPGYLTVIADSLNLLADEPADQFGHLAGILQDAAGEWAQPIERDEDWDRPACSFHLVFQVLPENEGALRKRFSGTKVKLADTIRQDPAQ